MDNTHDVCGLDLTWNPRFNDWFLTSVIISAELQFPCEFFNILLNNYRYCVHKGTFPGLPFSYIHQLYTHHIPNRILLKCKLESLIELVFVECPDNYMVCCKCCLSWLYFFACSSSLQLLLLLLQAVVKVVLSLLLLNHLTHSTYKAKPCLNKVLWLTVRMRRVCMFYFPQ